MDSRKKIIDDNVDLVYHAQSDNKHEAAIACVDAANCYKKTSNKGVLYVVMDTFILRALVPDLSLYN